MSKSNVVVTLTIIGMIFLIFVLSILSGFGFMISGIDQYHRISRDDVRSGILYKLGEPSFVANNNLFYATTWENDYVMWRDRTGSLSVIPSDRQIESYTTWRYKWGSSLITVEFLANDSIKEVSCAVGSGDEGCPPLLDVRVGDSEGDIMRVLGDPQWKKINRTTKAIAYADYGVIYFLEKDKVYQMTMLPHHGSKRVMFKFYLSNLLIRSARKMFQ